MLDTSTVILLGRIDDPADLPDEAVISAITLAELSVGPHVAHTDEERAARQAHLQQAESDFDVLVFDFRNHGQNVPAMPAHHTYEQLTRDLERVAGQQSRRWSITIVRGGQQVSVELRG